MPRGAELKDQGSDPEGRRRAVSIIVDGMAAVGVDRSVVERAFQADGWAEVYEKHTPPLAALAGSLTLPYGTYEIIDFLASAASTVAEAFDRLSKYLPVVTSHATWGWVVGPSAVHLKIVRHGGQATWFSDEWLIGSTIRGFRGILGDENFRIEELHLRSPMPKSTPSFPVINTLPPIRFGAPEAMLVVSRATWETPSPRANSRLHEVLLAHADELLREMKESASLARRVRQELVSELRGGDPTVQVIARKLVMTPRTLQRRLSEEGTSFVAILDSIRADLSTRYLADVALSVTEVAFLLGFSEPSAFARAHRRWFGRAPRARSSSASSDP